MTGQGTLRQIGEHLVRALAPLERACGDLDSFKTFLFQLGWEPQSLPPSYRALAGRVAEGSAAARALGAEPGAGEIAALIEKVAGVYRAIRALGEAPAGADAAAFLADVGDSLFEFLLAEYLATELPALFNCLAALGVVVLEDHPAVPGRPGHVRTRILYDQIPAVLTDPLSIPSRVYGWDTPELDFDLLAEHLLELFHALDFAVFIERPGRETVRGFQPASAAPATRTITTRLVFSLIETELGDVPVSAAIAVLDLPAEGARKPGIIVQLLLTEHLQSELQVDDDLVLHLRAGSDVSSSFGIVLRPGEIEVRYPSDTQPVPSAGFGVSLDYAPAEPVVLLGAAEKSRLQMAGATAGLDLDLRNQQLELRIGAEIKDLALVIRLEDLDGFVADVVGASDLTVPVPLRFEWSNRTGLSFMAGVGFAVSSYPHLEIGPIRVERLDLGLLSTFRDPPDLAADVGLSFSGAIGPLSFSAEGMGLRLQLRFADGNAGPFDIGWEVKGPTGLGIAIDAGPVTGGGFLSFQPDSGRYEGVLQLEIFDVAVTGIGLLDTRLPRGAPGFSFIVMISAQFDLQLGYGFTLLGVGGLLGVHRTVVVDALRDGLRNGAFDHILFAEDPIRTAPRIMSDLQAIFPAQRDAHLFGPVAKLGWGTPTVVTAELGIILQLPAGRLIIVGRVDMMLPTQEVAIIELHVDVLGVLDPESETLSIDASLHDSRIGPFAVYGDMALRLGWGDHPLFLFSVGGFHPAFPAPANFPSLERVTVALGMGGNPRITLQGYLALTSNSIQFGARAELYAEGAGFNVIGWVSFDALITFSPFSFRIDISAGMALRRGRTRIAGIAVRATLTGPSPYHVRGRASLSVLFFEISIPFEATFGERREASLPVKDVWPDLERAIRDLRNWSASLPEGVNTAVTLSAAAGESTALVQPMGSLTLRQRVTPLNRPISKIGEFRAAGHTRFDVTGVRVGDDVARSWSMVTDFFPPGHVQDLSEAEKLSRPAFEIMDAGVTVASAHVESGAPIVAEVAYEQRIIDSPWEGRVLARHLLPRRHQLAMDRLGPAARSALRNAGARKFARPFGMPRAFDLDPEEYVIVSTDDLTIRLDLGARMTRDVAELTLREHLDRYPEEVGALRVAPRHELDLAA